MQFFSYTMSAINGAVANGIVAPEQPRAREGY
jgi:hypothetical protein